MKGDLQLVTIPHPFRLSERDVRTVACAPNVSVLSVYLEYFPDRPDLSCTLNGRPIARGLWADTLLRPGDCLTFAAELHGGGDGKGILRALLMIAVVVAAVCMPNVWAQMAVMLVGGLLVNALLPPPAPKPPALSDSPSTYSWRPQNTEQQGLVVPRWYGEHRVYGNIVVSFIENVDSDQYLNLLISLGLGPVKGVSDFELNEQPQSSYKDFETWVRRGLLDQEPIEAFAQTKVEYPRSNALVAKDSPLTFLTEGNSFDALEVDVEFPLGLYRAENDGSFSYRSVDLTVEIQPANGTTWIPIARKDSGPTPVLVKLSQSRWSLGYQYGSTATMRYGNDRYRSDSKWVGKWVDAYFDTPPVFTPPPGRPGPPATFPDPFSRASHDPAKPREIVGYEKQTREKSPGVFEDYFEPVYYTWRWIDRKQEIVQIGPHTFENFFTARARRTSPVRYTFQKEISPEAGKGQYRVRVSRVSPDSASTRIGDRLYLSSIREVYKDPFEYPRQALAGYRVKATDQLSGSLSFSALLSGAIVRTFSGAKGAGAQSAKTTGLSTTLTTTANAFAPLSVGSEIRANGEFRTVTAKANDNQLTVSPPVNWENSGAGYPFTYQNWTFEWSDNPAWVAFDVLTQPVIAGSGTAEDPWFVHRFDGIDPVRIDLAKFREWADYCNEQVNLVDSAGTPLAQTEKRITFNGGFDSDTSLWEAVLKVCQVGRAVPVWNGLNLTLAIDKPQEPVFLFSVGNIEESRFKETFLSDEGRATEIEIDFTNRDSGFERDKLTVSRGDTETGNGFKASLDLFGVTKQSEAWRAGMYRLMCNRYLIRTVEIDVDIEALNATVGDVGYVQHDVPRWGEGGRIASGALDSATLDKPVTLKSGVTYKLLLRLADDTLCERTVSEGAGTYTTLHVTSPFPSAPQPFDVYALGEVSRPAKLFRIVEVSKTHEQKCTLRLIEYRPEVYQFENSAPPLQGAQASTLFEMLPRSVSLTPGKTPIVDANGAVSVTVTVDFISSTLGGYRHLEVWYRAKDGERFGWTFSGVACASPYKICGVAPESSLEVKLLPVDSSGGKLALDSAPSYSTQTEAAARAFDLSYADGASAEALKPAEAGAEKTAGKSLDVLADGTSYRRTRAGVVNPSGQIDFSHADLINRNLDHVSETTERKHLRTRAKTALFATKPVHGGNLLFNPNFEQDSDFWRLDANCSIVTDATKADNGNKYLQFSGVAGVCVGACSADDDGTMRLFEVNPGDTIFFTARYFRESGDQTARIAIGAYDKDRQDPWWPALADGTVSGSWQALKCAYTVPSGRKYVVVCVQTFGGTANSIVRFDAACLQIARPCDSVLYSDGASAEALKPAEVGAERTAGKSLDILSDGTQFKKISTAAKRALLTSRLPHGGNLLFNPNFEEGSAFWLCDSGISVTTDATKADNGNNYVQIVTTKNVWNTLWAADADGQSKFFEVNPGDRILFSAKLYRESGDMNCGPLIEVTDKDKANPTVIGGVYATAAAWTTIKGSYTVPVGKKYIRFAVQPAGDSGTVSSVIRVDACTLQIARRGEAVSYEDGTTVEALKPAEAGAEVTTGKSLDVLSDGTAYKRLSANAKTAVLSSRLPYGGNLLFNANFEQGSPFWSMPSGCSIAVDATKAQNGNRYMQFSGTAGALSVTFPVDADGNQMYFEVNEGDTVVFCAQYYRESGDQTARLTLGAYDKDKANATWPVCQDGNSSGAWTALALAYKVPAGRKYLTPCLQIYGGTAASIVRFDACSLAIGVATDRIVPDAITNKYMLTADIDVDASDGYTMDVITTPDVPLAPNSALILLASSVGSTSNFSTVKLFRNFLGASTLIGQSEPIARTEQIIGNISPPVVNVLFPSTNVRTPSWVKYPLYGGTGTESNQGGGQSFTTGSASYKVAQVDFWLSKVGTPTDDLTIEIADALNGGNILASGTFSASNLTTAPRRVSLSLSAASALAANTKYYIRLRRGSAYDTTNYVRIWTKSASVTYSGGDRLGLNSGTWSAGSNSVLFVVYAAITGTETVNYTLRYSTVNSSTNFTAGVLHADMTILQVKR